MINPKVSVVVPVFKVEPYIEKCCRSLFEQTLKEIEYIFVDDYSPDNSITLINQVLEEYPWRKEQVRFIRHSVNMGVAQSREDGNWEATGEYIIHCDGDDWVENYAYELMYNTAKEKDAEIVICNYYTVFNGKSYSTKYSISIESKENLNFGIQPFFGAVWNKLIKRKLYIENDIHVFKGINMSEDLGLTLRLRYFSRKTMIIQEALYYHSADNQDSIVSNYTEFKALQIVECVKKLHSFFNEKNVTGQYNFNLMFLKFQSKQQFLIFRGIRNTDLWKELFPETHKYIWQFSEAPIHVRIVSWLVYKNFDWLVNLILYLYDNRNIVNVKLK